MLPLRSLLFAIIAHGASAGPPELDAALDAIAPGIKKWASVCVITTPPDGTPGFAWHEYADSGEATDFWPASTIKLYAAIAGLELLTERGFPLETTVTFEHREADGRWVLDAARTMPEMLHAIFQRSSNEDYTLLLRMVGIDRINTQFLTPERGFPHSALMRGYVLGRPYAYVREEPQRITLRTAEGAKTSTHEHTWSGRSYSAERGATIIDAQTGNVTSARELAECLRRVLFHEQIPEAERYRLTPAQLAFLRHGGGGLTGLETTARDSDPLAWKDAADGVFPNARFFHKCGVISNYALEVAAVDDAAHSGTRFIVVPVVNAGEATQPERGQTYVRQMSRAIAQWVQQHSQPGWRPLFNGRDLENWTRVGSAEWRVADGAILGGQLDGNAKRSGMLATNEQFQDFELKLQFMMDEHGKYNSGVYLRNDSGTAARTGYQVNLGRAAAEEYCAGIFTDRWLAKGDVDDSIRRILDWNTLHIVARGAHLVVTLNGVKVVDFTDPNPPAKALQKGVIGFQTYGADGHAGWVMFRKIMIRELR